MKKYLLSLLLVAALVASFAVPTFGDGEVADTFKGDASIFLIRSNGNKLDGQSDELTDVLEDGYLYVQTKVNIESTSRVSGTEILELQATTGNLNNIESIEYSEKGGAWTDAFNYVVNTEHEFTNKYSIERNYRIKIKGPVSFCMTYKVFTPSGVPDYESYPRYVFIKEGEGGQLNSLTYFVKPTDPTTAESTSVTPSKETTTVAPTKNKKAKAPGKAKIKKVWKKKKSAKKLKIKLAKVKNAKGYQVCVYKNKKSAKKHIKAIVTKYTTKVKYTIKSKKLKKKKKLFVGVRAYNVSSDGSKVFGAWAKIKKVKIK